MGVLKREFNQHLGFWTGNEDIGRELEGSPKKLPMAQDIGQGNALEEVLQAFLQGFMFLRCEPVF